MPVRLELPAMVCRAFAPGSPGTPRAQERKIVSVAVVVLFATVDTGLPGDMLAQPDGIELVNNTGSAKPPSEVMVTVDVPVVADEVELAVTDVAERVNTVFSVESESGVAADCL
jgi:hypothetical protein